MQWIKTCTLDFTKCNVIITDYDAIFSLLLLFLKYFRPSVESSTSWSLFCNGDQIVLWSKVTSNKNYLLTQSSIYAMNFQNLLTQSSIYAVNWQRKIQKKLMNCKLVFKKNLLISLTINTTTKKTVIVVVINITSYPHTFSMVLLAHRKTCKWVRNAQYDVTS